MREWGFQAVLREMNAYDFWHYAMPQYVSQHYYTYQNGLQSITDALVAKLEASPMVTLCSHTRVLNIQTIPNHTTHMPQLHVSYQNDDDANIFHTKNSNICQKTFDMVCCALPAESIEEIRGIPQYYNHFWSSVSRNHLIRCYAKYTSIHNNAFVQPIVLNSTKTKQEQKIISKSKISKTKKNTNRNSRQLSKKSIKRSILHKCTTTHSPNWFQLAYCDHQHADHLYNLLRLPKGIQHLRQTVSKTIGTAWAQFDDNDFDVHFWKSGTHSWKPQLVSDHHYTRILHPDAKVPWFVVGSSFSHYQHWIEGALETVDDAYKKMWRFAVEWWNMGTHPRKQHMTKGIQSKQNEHHHQHVYEKPFYLHHACKTKKAFTLEEVQKNHYVVLDGYVYDIQPIMSQHPGGRKLLENVLGKDISKSYHRIGHSSTARAWVEQHCKGVLQQKKI